MTIATKRYARLTFIYREILRTPDVDTIEGQFRVRPGLTGPYRPEYEHSGWEIFNHIADEVTDVVVEPVWSKSPHHPSVGLFDYAIQQTLLGWNVTLHRESSQWPDRKLWFPHVPAPDHPDDPTWSDVTWLRPNGEWRSVIAPTPLTKRWTAMIEARLRRKLKEAIR